MAIFRLGMTVAGSLQENFTGTATFVIVRVTHLPLILQRLQSPRSGNLAFMLGLHSLSSLELCR